MVFSKWFRPKKGEEESPQKVEHYLLDAIGMFEDGDYHDSAKMFEQIISAIPSHPIANLMLARSQIKLRQYERAIQVLFNHLKVAPDSVEAMIYLGLAYHECGLLDRAKERFEEATKLRQDSLLARENLAITRIEDGELGKALDDLTELHKKYPSNVDILELMVLVLGRLGRWDTAKRYIQKKEKLAILGT